MTTEEMLQLLLGKFTGLENEVKEMRSGIKSLNDKVDASHTHIIKELSRIENKVDTNQINMIERFANLRADIVEELTRIECKIDNNHVDIIERFVNLRADVIKELNRIENKVDANHADVIKELNRIENKVDANLRADIIVINGKIDTAMEEQRLNRRVTQSAISELQFRQEHLEEDLRRSNRRLDNARQL